MKRSMLSSHCWAAVLTAGLVMAGPGFISAAQDASQPNRLTEAEKKAGWKLLFDGKTTHGWRGYNQDRFPNQGWVVQDGCLKHTDDGGGGDIITDEEFSDYEFSFEWKVASGANSGIKYFITEERGATIGHEYQVLDDSRHPDAQRGTTHSAASFYDVLPPHNVKTRPVGEFNQGRIRVQGKHVEHWLNGVKVLEYELGSDRLKKAVAQSKFNDVDNFGEKYPHHILLQDHGDEVWYRNLKIRELPAN